MVAEAPNPADSSGATTQDMHGNNQESDPNSELQRKRVSADLTENVENASGEEEEVEDGSYTGNSSYSESNGSLPVINLPDEKESDETKGISDENFVGGNANVNCILLAIS